MDSKELDSGYRIISVLLVESYFKRAPNVKKPEVNTSPILDVEITGDTKEGNIVVGMSVSLSVGDDEKKPDITAQISMVGHFKKFGNPQLPEDRFANINAPAIIYPFIREHLSTLSTKAGVGQILIPPLNFTRKQEDPKTIDKPSSKKTPLKKKSLE